MRMEEIKSLALEKGIMSGKLKKGDLIRIIQTSEGNFPCFGRLSISSCDQADCLWRPDCTLQQ
jgi:hypothetical protein